MKRVGLLGGAFNPPHQAHLRLARLALDHLDLDELRVVPTALSPHKPTLDDPGPEARLALLARAFEGFDARLRLEPLELARGGTSYTVDTLEALAAREPDTAWILVMGSDQLPGLPAWRRPERVFALASAAVALRPGSPFEVPAGAHLRAVPAWSGGPGELVALPATELDLASSAIRADLHGRPDRDPAGLPTQVLATIRAENLYR